MKEEIIFPRKEWFLETSFPGVRRCKADAFRIQKEIYKGRSKFQDIYIFESPGFGKMLALDGIIQLSQADEFIYHEVISHIPLLSHPHPKHLLVIGGGDGGVLREAAKHPLKEIYFVDIDKQVVEVAKKYLSFISQGVFADKRVKVFFTDGKKLVRGHKNFFDVIVVDSTDPVGPGKVLFQLDFYRLVFDALKKDGIAIFQLGPFLDFDLIVKPTCRKLKELFTYVNPVRLPMPSYSCGSEYCFVMVSKKINPQAIPEKEIARRLRLRLTDKEKSLRYYTPSMHQASMAMPKLWQLAK
ncbi:MAG: polyamine aminopropyltransferase [Candidatus Omnitrophota bacterium]|nr:polyamine aminopropyltransferase [Candidatus Omnitrophota bacterium]